MLLGTVLTPLLCDGGGLCTLPAATNAPFCKRRLPSYAPHCHWLRLCLPQRTPARMQMLMLAPATASKADEPKYPLRTCFAEPSESCSSSKCTSTSRQRLAINTPAKGLRKLARPGLFHFHVLDAIVDGMKVSCTHHQHKKVFTRPEDTTTTTRRC